MKKRFVASLCSTVILGCNQHSFDLDESDVRSTEASSPSVLTQTQEMCAQFSASASTKDVSEALGLICTKGGQLSDNVLKGLKTPFTGTNSIDQAVFAKIDNLGGNRTALRFVSVIKVEKSLDQINSRRLEVLNLAYVSNDVKVTNSYSGEKKMGSELCYDTREVVDAGFGEAVTKGRECNVKLASAHQHNVQYNAGEEKNQKVSFMFELESGQTWIVSGLQKVVNNLGFHDIAASKMNGQPQAAVKKIYSILAASSPSYLVAGSLTGDAVDEDKIGQGDWAPGRTKLSCKPGDGIVSVLQQSVYGGKQTKSANLSMSCRRFGTPRSGGFSHASLKLGEGVPAKITLECGEGEYAAGLSYARYNDRVTLLADGVKSLLCAKTTTPRTQCVWTSEKSCDHKSVMTGIRAERNGGLICQGKSSADAGSGCHSITEIQCCQ